MSSIFPLRDTVTRDNSREPRLVDLDEETADEVFEALSSQTTREIFLELHHSPQTTSDLAEATDTSVQNVQYHLEKLTDADLVEVVDTWYSERGTEMDVYAPEDESLVLFAGRDKQRTLRDLLNRVVGVLGVLVPGSILAGLGAQWIPTSGGTDGTEATNTGGDAPESDGAGGAETDGDLTVQGEDGVTGTETVQGGDAPDSGVLGVDDSVDGVDIEYSLQNTDTLPAGEAELVIGNETVDTARIPTSQPTNTENATAAGDVAVTDVDVTYDLNETALNSPAPNESGGDVAAPDNATTGDLGTEVANNGTDVADAAASVDPTLAAAAGFFVGGLLIFLALTAWYGDR